ncbi:HepT-like ribonuclease domain-containing protein [Geosporobacter ferrireducens]|uniref:DUF86 domain-containing protein n=1 Tax=Geosporobacter ferrireducens TaxID=1424294 RepID=A0A1D8GI40_9FIRM|nr:DUF86 domain-containing protein [Geosporobacter ferrireducens]AOT70559.1 hypothetical protein Gferi_13845 [Geosporobacter ferrireducens]
MQRELKIYIEDIITAIGKIRKYTTGMSKEDLIRNELVQDAVIRNLEVIGEAVKKIPDDIRINYKDIPWKKIAGLRDILIHEYFGVNMNIVWDVIENKLQPLQAAVIELQMNIID